MEIKKVRNLTLTILVVYLIAGLSLQDPAVQPPLTSSKIPFKNTDDENRVPTTFVDFKTNPGINGYSGAYGGKDNIVKGKFVTFGIQVACGDAECQKLNSYIDFNVSTLESNIYIPTYEKLPFFPGWSKKFKVEVEDFSSVKTEKVVGFGSVDFVNGKTVFGVEKQDINAGL